MSVQAAVFACAAVMLSSCTTTTPLTAETAPEYMIVKGYAPFYKLGPMQGRPDASLPLETRIKVLRNEAGFSLVQLEDSRQGYVANENMAPAPPKPPAPPADAGTIDPRTGKKKGGNRPNSPRYTGEQLNDIPLPDVNVPAPDLNIGSEDITAPAPTPTPPTEKPKFRY
jgi:hypothetical protein